MRSNRTSYISRSLAAEKAGQGRTATLSHGRDRDVRARRVAVAPRRLAAGMPVGNTNLGMIEGRAFMANALVRERSEQGGQHAAGGSRRGRQPAALAFVCSQELLRTPPRTSAVPLSDRTRLHWLERRLASCFGMTVRGANARVLPALEHERPDQMPAHSRGSRPIRRRERSRHDDGKACGKGTEWSEAESLIWMLQGSGLGHWRHEVATDRFSSSDGLRTLLGLRRDDIVTSYTELRASLPPQDWSPIDVCRERAIASSDAFELEHRFTTRTGEHRWVMIRGRVARCPDVGEVLVGIAVDITPQKDAEAERERLIAELAAERARLRALVAHIPAAVLVSDAAATIVLTNPAVESVFPVPQPQVPVSSRELFDAWQARHPDGRPVESSERPLSRALRGESVDGEDFRYLRADGTETWLRIASAPIKDDASLVTGAVVIAACIDKEKRAEAERESLLRSLAESEERYRLVALASEDAIYDWNLETDRVCYQWMFGHAAAAVASGISWATLIHPEDRDAVLASLHDALEGSSRYWRAEYRFRSGSGDWLVINDRGYVVTNDAGRPVRLVGAMQDITLRRRQQEFERQLIGIVSHDLRNPLSAILLASELMLRSSDEDSLALKNATRVKNAGERAMRLVHDLLDFTRARLGGGIALERRELDLGVSMPAVVDDIRIAHSNRPIVFESRGDCTGAFDGDRLAQVVTNLVENALKYSPEDSAVRVTLDGGADGVALAVHNDGPPIPSELLPRIFEPLQRGDTTFDPASRSVGLGLYIVKKLVEAHGGSVQVVSSAPKGTTFTVRLPRGA